MSELRAWNTLEYTTVTHLMLDLSMTPCAFASTDLAAKIFVAIYE